MYCLELLEYIQLVWPSTRDVSRCPQDHSYRVRQFFSYNVLPYCLRTVVVYSPVYSVYTASCTHNRPPQGQQSPHSAPCDMVSYFPACFTAVYMLTA